MSETAEIIVGIVVLIGVYIFTRRFHAWRLKQTYLFIIRDLKAKEAFSPETAVTLPYAKVRLFRVGTRDYRPKALQHLTMSDIVGQTQNDKYYLKDKNTPDTLPGR
ncbi:MAG: hypothetical protein R6U38_05335 [Desulfatiglandaceae bacterium]